MILKNLKNRDCSLKYVFGLDDISATFAIWTPNGQLVGYQRYTPNLEKKKNNPQNCKYYTYINKFYNPGWGWEFHKGEGPIFVVEGIFDAIKLLNLKLDAVAALTCSTSKIFKAELLLTRRPIYAILDNDNNKSGERLANFASKAFPVPKPYEDLGDMPQKEVRKFMQENMWI